MAVRFVLRLDTLELSVPAASTPAKVRISAAVIPVARTAVPALFLIAPPIAIGVLAAEGSPT